MIKTYTIDMSKEEFWLNYLESLSYEVKSRESLIDFLIQQGHKKDSDFIEKYHTEYQDFFIQYDIAKNKFTNEFILKKYPNMKKWDLNFYTKTLII